VPIELRDLPQDLPKPRKKKKGKKKRNSQSFGNNSSENDSRIQRQNCSVMKDQPQISVEQLNDTIDWQLENEPEAHLKIKLDKKQRARSVGAQGPITMKQTLSRE
jgi:hypothetical protein